MAKDHEAEIIDDVVCSPIYLELLYRAVGRIRINIFRIRAPHCANSDPVPDLHSGSSKALQTRKNLNLYKLQNDSLTNLRLHLNPDKAFSNVLFS